MTDEVAALGCLVHVDCEERREALARFEERWGQGAPRHGTSGSRCKRRHRSPAPWIGSWNSCRIPPSTPATRTGCAPSSIPSAHANPVRFHAADGSGYRFWEERDARDRSAQPRGRRPPRGRDGALAPVRRRAARPDGGGGGSGPLRARSFEEHERSAHPDSSAGVSERPAGPCRTRPGRRRKTGRRTRFAADGGPYGALVGLSGSLGRGVVEPLPEEGQTGRSQTRPGAPAIGFPSSHEESEPSSPMSRRTPRPKTFATASAAAPRSPPGRWRESRGGPAPRAPGSTSSSPRSAWG